MGDLKLENFFSFPKPTSLIKALVLGATFTSKNDNEFDDNLIIMIVNSDLEKDWDAMGWRGIMLGNGQVWLDYDGTVHGINYQSTIEKNIKTKLIEAQKNTLHQSVRDYAEPVLEWRTKKFRIRIDDLAKHKYRYVAWAVNKKTSEKPDLVLFNGEITFDGNGGNHNYTFSNGIYQYNCVVNVIGTSETPAGELEVYKNGKLIFSDPVVEVSGE